MPRIKGTMAIIRKGAFMAAGKEFDVDDSELPQYLRRGFNIVDPEQDETPSEHEQQTEQTENEQKTEHDEIPVLTDNSKPAAKMGAGRRK
jgi:hypothetical protein